MVDIHSHIRELCPRWLSIPSTHDLVRKKYFILWILQRFAEVDIKKKLTFSQINNYMYNFSWPAWALRSRRSTETMLITVQLFQFKHVIFVYYIVLFVALIAMFELDIYRKSFKRIKLDGNSIQHHLDVILSSRVTRTAQKSPLI